MKTWSLLMTLEIKIRIVKNKIVPQIILQFCVGGLGHLEIHNGEKTFVSFHVQTSCHRVSHGKMSFLKPLLESEMMASLEGFICTSPSWLSLTSSIL